MPRRPSAQHYSSRSYGSLPVDERRARLGPIAFWVVIGTLVVMTAWTIPTITYFAFREDLLAALLARQAQMQFAYQNRIPQLHALSDRFYNPPMIDPEEDTTQL